MNIIAIEGLDKAGKHTATGVLVQFLEAAGLNVVEYGFPNYDAPVGALVHAWLKGEFDAPYATFELLQAADKHYGQTLITMFEGMGVDVLVVDRYLHSQWAYGGVDNDPAWVKGLTAGCRLPDAVVYLDVEPEVSLHRGGKFGENDRYEEDLGRLRATRDRYVDLFDNPPPDVAHVPVFRVDANQPQLLVKANLFGVAKELVDTLGLTDAVQTGTTGEPETV